MATFESNSFLCRVSRSVRLYRSVYDTTDCSMVLTAGQIFTSEKQYIRNHVKLYHITTSDVNGLPIGYWCPQTALNTMPIVVPEAKASEIQGDGSTTIETELIVKAHGSVVYRYSTGDSVIPSDMALGDHIMSDRQIELSVDGKPETRYRIASFTGEDQSLIGGWIVNNRAIREVHPDVTEADTPMLLSMLPSDTTGGGASTGGGSNTTQSNTANNPTTEVVPNNSGGTTVKLPDDTDAAVQDANSTNDDAAQEVIITTENYNDENFMKKLYESYGMDYFGSSDASLMGTPIGRMIFVHGMPFQYTHLTDRRGHSKTAKGMAESEYVTTKVSGGSADMYGRTFAKEIAGNMPIAVMVPGKPKFLTNVKSGLFRGATASNDTMAGVLPAFGASDTRLGEALAEAVSSLSGDYQYYSLEVAVPDYFEYVNSMAHSAARFMGIGDLLYRGVKLENFDWAEYNSDASQEYGMFQEIVGLSGGVSFAYDPQGAVTDSLSNSTGESKFASFFNNINSQAREIEFVMGYSGVDAYKLIDSANFVGESQTAMQGGLFGGLESVIDRVGTWLKNSLHGMNMRFPEIWNESQHSRGYDIEMHFIAPYATPFCKYRYVLVPFFHVFCLVAPKSDSNVSQYSSPFLIRAYSKGY
ncbi:MAG: hypothetical protein NC489_09160, partial [Ruminococcus flavefaciens]|nr:hypothetical protein [Ruminococcus flavefaciens]